MKRNIIIISIASLALFGCKSNNSKSQVEKVDAEQVVLKSETLKNESITNELEIKAKSIEEASQNLESILKELE